MSTGPTHKSTSIVISGFVAKEGHRVDDCIWLLCAGQTVICGPGALDLSGAPILAAEPPVLGYLRHWELGVVGKWPGPDGGHAELLCGPDVIFETVPYHH